MESLQRILLISNSTVYGCGYLDHVEQQIQEERILQFLEENETPVVGIREGAWLVCENDSVTLKGEAGARIFRRGKVPVEAKPGDNIIDLVGAPNGS
jgi:dipeptidase E